MKEEDNMFSPAKSIEDIMQNECVRKRISFGLMWAYLWIVLMLQTIKNGSVITLRFSALLFLLSAGVAFLTLKILGKLLDFDTEPPTTSKKNFLFVLVVFLITFAFYMTYFGAQYPGDLGPDTINQYRQAINGKYNNWHPVLHTLLYFTLPLKTGHRLGFVVFLQLLYFCLTFAYLVYVLYRNGCPKVLLGTICAYVWVSPYLAWHLMRPLKDCALTTFAILLVAYYIQIMCSDGGWLNKKKNILAFSLIAILCTYMRHNAVLFVAPLVIIVLVHGAKDRTRRLWVGCSILLFVLLVQGLYKNLGVVAPNKRIVETVGLPTTIFCNVMQKKPKALPKSTQKVLYQLATDEAYKKNYKAGSFNSIKWTKKFDTNKLDKLSYRRILKYTWQCFRYAPKESFEALAILTGLVWDLDGTDSPGSINVRENSWGIKRHPKFGITFFNQIKSLFAVGAGRVLFGSIGFANLMMLAVGLIMFARGRLTIIHYFPLFCYNFGTMLLLSGRDHRFFLLNLPLWLPVIFLMYKDRSL